MVQTYTTHGKVILLVEDSPDDEALTLRALRRLDLPNEPVVLRDGEEALDYLLAGGAAEEAQQLPNVVFLDLKLPKTGGLEVLQRLRQDERTKLLPVVVLSSSNEERDIIESYNLGANSYICKPADASRFNELIQQLGVYWLTINERLPR